MFTCRVYSVVIENWSWRRIIRYFGAFWMCSRPVGYAGNIGVRARGKGCNLKISLIFRAKRDFFGQNPCNYKKYFARKILTNDGNVHENNINYPFLTISVFRLCLIIIICLENIILPQKCFILWLCGRKYIFLPKKVYAHIKFKLKPTFIQRLFPIGLSLGFLANSYFMGQLHLCPPPSRKVPIRLWLKTSFLHTSVT